jgi:hypothetical protein
VALKCQDGWKDAEINSLLSENFPLPEVLEIRFRTADGFGFAKATGKLSQGLMRWKRVPASVAPAGCGSANSRISYSQRERVASHCVVLAAAPFSSVFTGPDARR